MYKLEQLHIGLSDAEWQKVYAFRSEYLIDSNTAIEYENWQLLRQQYLVYLNKGIGLFIARKEERAFGYFNIINGGRSGETYSFLKYDLQQNHLEEELLGLIFTAYLNFSAHADYLVFTSIDARNDYIEKCFLPEVSEIRELFEVQISDLNIDLITKWSNQEHLSGDYEVMFVNELPSHLLDEFYALRAFLNADVTHRSKLFDDRVLSKEQVLNQEQAYKKRGVIQLVLLIVDPRQQKLAGYTDITIEPAYPEVIKQNMTGILKEYRGKGLSKLLKARMAEHLLKEYPNLTRIKTGIHPENTRSQRLNAKMGFQKVGEYKEYIISRQKIVDYLKP